MDDSPEGQTQYDVIAETKAQVTSLAIVENYEIQSIVEAHSLAQTLQKIKGLSKQIAEAKDAERRPLNDALKLISGRYKEAEDVLERAEATIKGSLLFFQREEDKRIADERRAAAQAAAAERARLEEAARKERERAEKEAEALRAKGRDEKADAVMQVAESKARAQETVASLVAAPVKPMEPTKFAGVSTRKKWVGKVDDPVLFIQSLAKSPYPLAEFVDFNQAALNRLAGSLQGNMDRVLPGCIAWQEDIVASRSK
jgi:leucyl aminopeptidase